MNISVRRAVAADSPGVVRVIRAVYDEYRFIWDPDDYHADLYDLQGHYLDPGHAFWVAEGEGEIVGTVALELFDPVPGTPAKVAELEGVIRLCGCDCSLERLYVHPDARRRGAGALLLETVVREARVRGRRRMEIWSDKRFQDAHRLYQRLGAIQIADRVCHDPDQSPEWGLLLTL
jgi:putative acetyltransferase